MAPTMVVHAIVITIITGEKTMYAHAIVRQPCGVARKRYLMSEGEASSALSIITEVTKIAMHAGKRIS